MQAYHALRRVGNQVEEIKVSRPKGGSLADEVTEHVAWHDDEGAALASMRTANKALFPQLEV